MARFDGSSPVPEQVGAWAVANLLDCGYINGQPREDQPASLSLQSPHGVFDALDRAEKQFVAREVSFPGIGGWIEGSRLGPEYRSMLLLALLDKAPLPIQERVLKDVIRGGAPNGVRLEGKLIPYIVRLAMAGLRAGHETREPRKPHDLPREGVIAVDDFRQL